MPAPDAVLVTCEHGGNTIPAPYRRLFRDASSALNSHRGHDIGALDIARRVARALPAPIRGATVSRLLVDLNRSPGHPRLFSSFVKSAGAPAREAILAKHYLPYRLAVEEDVLRMTKGRRFLLHLSVHSFTPVLNGRRRDVDIGLLYDPSRRRERTLCVRWQRLLAGMRPDLRIRRNAPYRGTADGLTTHLRGRHDPDRYAGIEIEVSQALAAADPASIAGLIIESLLRLLPGERSPRARGGRRPRREGGARTRRRNSRPADRSTRRSSRTA